MVNNNNNERKKNDNGVENEICAFRLQTSDKGKAYKNINHNIIIEVLGPALADD